MVLRVGPSFSGLMLLELEVTLWTPEYATETCPKSVFPIHLREVFNAFLVTCILICLDLHLEEEEEVENSEVKLI